MVGAILTQNAAWSNVEQAIANLKGARKLTPHALLRLPVRRLETLIQPSGFFRVKARRLRSFLSYFVVEYDGSVDRMRRRHLPRLREELLAVHGIGPETADSMLLYALGKPCFVVDAYTRRILSRHGLIRHPDDYEEVKALFERNLPGRVRLLNEYHALLVRLAKTHCRNKPLCSGCPLASLRRGRT
jgi:endonuclease-3 related protein